MQLYFQLHDLGKAKTLRQAAMRNVNIVVDIIGDGASVQRRHTHWRPLCLTSVI